MTELIGMIAAVLTTLSFVPQAVHILRTGQTEGISLIMYALFTTGISVWLAYGILLGALPIILSNAVTLVLAATILVLKIRAVIQARSSAHGAAEETSAPIAS
jgi:MtN3 and saliva related transmembrane protein